MKKKLYLQALLVCLTIGFSFSIGYSQCPAVCTYTEANGPFINMNGNETLCITSNTGDLSINFNGSNNVICVAPGVTWTQTNGMNFNGVTVNVYGTWVMNGGISANSASTINIYSGATFTTASTGFGHNITINNAGTTTFTATGQISNAGNFVFNNTAGATLTATATSLFKVGNGNSFDNYGTMTFSNLENEEANLFYNRSSGFISIGRYFYNHGAFLNEGEVETICGSFGVVACEFIVGDKGPGKTFVNNACFSVTGNVRFDGPATNNDEFEIINGDLTINKPVTGTNGRFILTNGISTINLAGSYSGTNLRICDQNTAGNGFDVVNNTPSSNLYTVDCSANTCTAAPPACTNPILTDLTNETICTGGSFTPANVTTSVTNGVTVTYQWYNNNGINNPGTMAIGGQLSATLTALPATTGSYSYLVRATNAADNTCFAEKTVTLTVNSTPVLSTNNASICIGNTADLRTLVTNNSPAGTLSFYTSQANADAAANALLNSVVAPASTTTYYVRSQLGACYSTANITITTNNSPNPSVTNGTICSGGSINLSSLVSNADGGTLSFYSTLSDAQAATNNLASSTVNPTTATTYYVRSTNASGCYGVKKILVVLAAPNCGPINVSGPN